MPERPPRKTQKGTSLVSRRGGQPTRFDTRVRQAAFIRLMTSEPYPSFSEAAATLGYTERQIWKWYEKDPEFKRRLDAAVESLDRTMSLKVMDRIRKLAAKAIETKEQNLDSKSPHVRHLESSWLLEKLPGMAPQAGKLTLEGTIHHDFSDMVRKVAEDQARRGEQPVIDLEPEAGPDPFDQLLDEDTGIDAIAALTDPDPGPLDG